MTLRPALPAAPVALAATVALLVSGCSASVSFGDKTVAADDIGQEASTQLQPQAKQKIESVDCPEDLDAKAGEKETCSITLADGSTYDMTAKITSVDDNGKAQFHFQVTKQTG